MAPGAAVSILRRCGRQGIPQARLKGGPNRLSLRSVGGVGQTVHWRLSSGKDLKLFLNARKRKRTKGSTVERTHNEFFVGVLTFLLGLCLGTARAIRFVLWSRSCPNQAFVLVAWIPSPRGRGGGACLPFLKFWVPSAESPSPPPPPGGGRPRVGWDFFGENICNQNIHFAPEQWVARSGPYPSGTMLHLQHRGPGFESRALGYIRQQTQQAGRG